MEKTMHAKRDTEKKPMKTHIFQAALSRFDIFTYVRSS